MSDMAVLELPFVNATAAKRALRRGAYRVSARELRRRGYLNAAMVLEDLAHSLDTHEDAFDETTIVDLPL